MPKNKNPVASAPAEDPASYPHPLRANYVLIVLLLAYVLSFVDRNILAVLVGPVRAEFAISDFQFSILHGWAFTLFYIFLGLPIGWLADRASRKWIITIGIFFWSLMTCACGLARQFGTLFLARVGVGVGEAALSPPTYSLLSDYFPPHQLRWATSIFAMGITLGSGLSFLIGGWLYDQLQAVDLTAWPWLAGFSAWQLTFIAVGLPGFLVVLMLLPVREPARRIHIGKSNDVAVPLSELRAHLSSHWQAYGALVAAICLKAVVGYGTMTWFLECLVRTYGIGKTEAGAMLGPVYMIGGSAGMVAGAAAASWLQARGYVDANMRVVMLSSLLVLLPALAAPLMPTAGLAVALSWLVMFVHYSHFGVGMAALQLITPNRMRAQVTAMLLFMSNLFGLALGGSFVAFFTDFVFGDDLALRYSLVAVYAICYPLAALVVALGLKHYRTALAAV